VLAAGFGVSRATAYRYRDEVIAVLHAEAPDLHDGRPVRGRRAGLVARHRGRQGVPYRPLRRNDHQYERHNDQLLVLGQASRVRRERPGRDATGWLSCVDLRRGCCATTTTSSPPAGSTFSARCTGRLHSSTCPRWPTPATKAQSKAYSRRPSSPATATSSGRTIRPTPRDARDRRARLRPAHHSPAGAVANHRQPGENRSDRRRRTCTHLLRTPATKPISLRSPQSRAYKVRDVAESPRPHQSSAPVK
jgi:hypothetical protein